MPAIDLSYANEDECYFENEEIWNKYDPITIVKNNDVNSIKIYLDDGNEDEGKFYISCEKLYNSLKEKMLMLNIICLQVITMQNIYYLI